MRWPITNQALGRTFDIVDIIISSFQSCKVGVLGAKESRRGPERLGNRQENTQLANGSCLTPESLFFHPTPCHRG